MYNAFDWFKAMGTVFCLINIQNYKKKFKFIVVINTGSEFVLKINARKVTETYPVKL